MTSFFTNLKEKASDAVKNLSDVTTNVVQITNGAIQGANTAYQTYACSSANDSETCTNLYNKYNVKCIWTNDDTCSPCIGLDKSLCAEPCAFNNETNTCA